MEARRSVSDLLRAAADRIEELERAPSTSSQPQGQAMLALASTLQGEQGAPGSAATPSVSTAPGRLIHPVDSEVSRLFAPYSRIQTGGPRRNHSRTSLSAPSYTHTFCCLLSKQATSVPQRNEKTRLHLLGLGEKRLTFRGNQESAEAFSTFILDAFPKLRDAGGFELMRISGSTRSRNLTLLSCPNDGYTISYLRDPATAIHNAILYIRPLQRNLCVNNTTQMPNNQETELGPVMPCLTCGEGFAFAELKRHSESCLGQPQTINDENASDSSSRVTSALILEEPTESPRLETASAGASDYPIAGWVTEEDPLKAALLFTISMREAHEDDNHLSLTLSLHDSIQDRDRNIIHFYKMPRTEWANQLRCKLIGDSAVGEGVNRYVLSTVMDRLQNGFMLNETDAKVLLFEGERDHLVPSTSQTLLESDLFIVAGRIIGHSFLNDGPRFCGLSQAVIHVLLGGEPEMATIEVEDCVDLELREIVTLLEGGGALQEEAKSKILAVCLLWDLPGVTAENRWWLKDKILTHAVLGRISRQVQQIRKGLKDTGVWEFLSSRPDAVTTLFPRAAHAVLTSQMVLEKIVWPTEEDEVVVTIDEQCRAVNFLRQFIQTSSPEVLKSLLSFWTGWDVLPVKLHVEVVAIQLPQASTCFCTLKLPGSTVSYDVFKNNLHASISSSFAGFGQY